MVFIFSSFPLSGKDIFFKILFFYKFFDLNQEISSFPKISEKVAFLSAQNNFPGNKSETAKRAVRGLKSKISIFAERDKI